MKEPGEGNHFEAKPAITLINWSECLSEKQEVRANYLCQSFLSSYLRKSKTKALCAKDFISENLMSLDMRKHLK